MKKIKSYYEGEEVREGDISSWIAYGKKRGYIKYIVEASVKDIILKEKEKWSGVNMVVGSDKVLKALKSIETKYK